MMKLIRSIRRAFLMLRFNVARWKSNSDPLRILSLGAGVQSSTIALMFARGELSPMPHAAIFADTGAEPKSVYAWLDWLELRLPFPVIRVKKAAGLTANIEESVAGGRFAGAPFFANTGDGAGILRRQCTQEFKIEPIVAQVRRLVGLKYRQKGPKDTILAVQYIGISVDEIFRMKPSRIGWIKHVWPLVDLRLTRHDCILWMERNGYPKPPRSACVYCPYKSNAEWKALRDSDPDGWKEACRVDAVIRTGVRGVRDPIFVHRSLKPLPEVDLSTDFDRGQGDLFANECEGICGN